ncbi:MAG: sensor histidine kinase [Roseiflexaceae bacterium]
MGLLRSLPIRWQITVLHATILAVVLAAGGAGLWNAQRTFQRDSLLGRQLTELRTVIPEELDPKLAAGLYMAQKPDPATLKEQYATIVAELLPPGADPAVVRKRIALLDPKLADQVFPPGADLPARDEMEKIVSKLVFELFPPDADPLEARKKLIALNLDQAAAPFLSPAIDQTALQMYAADLVKQVSTKDRSIAILALDGSLLAQNGSGPDCSPSAFVLKAAYAGQAREAFFTKLRATRYLDQVDNEQLTLLLPIIWQQNRPLALAQICVPIDAIDASLNQLAISLAVGGLLVVGLATTLGVTATRRVLRPLDQVIATTKRIAAGDLRQRVGLPPGRTEIGQLGAAFDAMVARLEAAFAAQRRFVADAAHELRTPLTALSASVELLLMGAADQDPSTTRRLLRHLDSELSRVIRLTNDLLTLSRLDARPRIDLRPIDLSALIAEASEQSRALLCGQELQIDIAPGLCVQGDSDRLRQVVLNLLDNARKYTPPGGRISLRADAARRPSTADQGVPDGQQASFVHRPSSFVVVEVEDTGVGIPPDALPHLFERFYRVDSARTRASGGSGLGLAIVYAIVQAHGGRIAVQSTPGASTCVTIQLPLSRPIA